MRNHSLEVYNKSLFAEMFPLPGLGSLECRQYILCVVSRRLHYARVVWVVNQYACFGRLQGNVEHLRKATGFLLNSGLTKDLGLHWQNASKVMLFSWQNDPEHLSLDCYSKPRIHKAFFVRLWSKQTGSTEIGIQVSQSISKLFKQFLGKCWSAIKSALWRSFTVLNTT